MIPETSQLLIALTDPLFLAAAGITLVLAIFVVVTARRQSQAAGTGTGTGTNAGSTSGTGTTASASAEAASASKGPALKPGKGRTLAELADHEEVDESSLLSRFVLNAKGETVGETMALEPDEVILKREGAFYALALDAIIEKDGMLLVDAQVDWEAAKEAGDQWREASRDEMRYDESGMPVVDE